MPRPKSKNELLELSQKNYEKLLDLIDSYSSEELKKEFPEGKLNRNISDVLTHLHQWHLMFLEWYKVGMKGDKPEMPAPGYTWKTLPELNKKIQKDYQNTDLKQALKLLSKSYTQVRKLIEKHTNDELFTKKLYKWTGSTSL